MEGKRQGEKKKDSTVNENNLEYKCQQALNHMCLTTIFETVQLTTFETASYITSYKFNF